VALPVRASSGLAGLLARQPLPHGSARCTGKAVPGTTTEVPAETNFSRIWAVVRAIPRGLVMTYGQVAAAAGFSHGARLAGRAMHAGQDLPWHRVVASAGPGLARISIRDPATSRLQRTLLRREGVELRPDGCIELERFGAANEPRAAPERCE
jgi:methylated-DNA-protein-cysteine methyltransferase related protein